ncbi:MAG: hypothetical protein ACREJF_03490 [Candidatus Methylomirabilales bacterium]
MSAKINGLGQVDGVAADVGLSLMQLGMVTGLHAAISPSVFTFTCFAKKPAECAIAKRTLWISLAATTIVNVGTLAVFKRWMPAIIGQLIGVGLFGLGMHAVASNETAPDQPTMEPKPREQLPENVAGVGRINGLGFNPTRQPGMMVAQDHWLDRKYQDSYSRWWEIPESVKTWR